jgi:hypothetical protein
MDVVLAALEARDCRPRATYHGGYYALCPSHEDRSPSLTLTQRDDRILVHCHAGCSVLQVLDALDLEWTDLFETDEYGR